MGTVWRSMAANLSVGGELLRYMWKRKWWWLIPLLFVLVVFGILLILGTTTGLGPFIYTIF